MPRNHGSYQSHNTSDHSLSSAGDLDPLRDNVHATDTVNTVETLTDIDRMLVLGEGLIQPALTPSESLDYTGEIPVEGAGATARWVALYDRARDLRAALRPGDPVGARQMQRAVRSLFLYEHQLTAKTRRRARITLWQRDRRVPLPAFIERVRWAECRCQQCQPALWEMTTAQHAALLRTA